MIDDSVEIALTCPVCGHHTSKSVASLRGNRDFYVCEECGETAKLDGVQTMLDTIDEASRDLRDFGDAIEGLGG